MDDIKKLEGTVVSGKLLRNMSFIEKSKEEAEEYEWLFHCTRADNLLSILESRELWLSNLKIMNDQEEVERIDVPEYENKYYVISFTYDSEITDEHWREYGGLDDGVLIGMKREWIEREAVFMNDNNKKSEEEPFKIFTNRDAILKYQKEQELIDARITNPFFIENFKFYKITYDDKCNFNIKNNCVMEINGQVLHGEIITPAVAGLIKSTKGICKRDNSDSYEKDWTIEKEIRLKIIIKQLDIFTNGHETHDDMIMKKPFFSKIAVPLTEDAFDTIKIKFSPSFKDKELYLKKLKNIISEDKIEVLQ